MEFRYTRVILFTRLVMRLQTTKQIKIFKQKNDKREVYNGGERVREKSEREREGKREHLIDSRKNNQYTMLLV